MTTTQGTPQQVVVSCSRGNLARETRANQGSSTVTRTFAYDDTGMV